MTKGTPLYECVGLMPSADRPSNTVCSFASVHDDLSAKAKSYGGKYQQFVLEYAVEWEKIIRTRIDNGLKKAEQLRIELDHYQKKTESLRLAANQAMAKGKSVASTQQEKLTRNEEKLIASKQSYNTVATDLCILMEEVTERSWRDLHPLLIKCAQFDMTLANDEAKALSNLNQVVASLKQVATEKGLSAQPRLKDLAGLKPELLSTRPGGVAGLQIEAGPSTVFGTNLNSPTTAIAPGSFGGQGQGGFPVQISPTSEFGRSHSMTSFHSAPPPSTDPFESASSQMNMLTISSGSAAPAPTLDDVYGSNYPSSTRSAPVSGNLPSMPPTTPVAPSSNSWAVRSSSFNDADSTYSGYSGSFHMAPPSMPPPPPPNMPPPPPPGGGLPPLNPAYGAPPSYGGGYDSYSQPPPPQQQQQQQYGMYGNQPNYQQPQSNPNYNPFG